MTRESFQRGHVSKPVSTARGTKFIIRWRVETGDSKSKHKSETIYGDSIKQARAVLAERIRQSSTQSLEASEFTVQRFVDEHWRKYLDRKNIKPSTRRAYESGLKQHILPGLGQLRMSAVVPLHIDELYKVSQEHGLSSKSLQNLHGLLQSIFSLAVDCDLLLKSPIRDKQKPVAHRVEKTTWTPEQIRGIVESVPVTSRPLFECVALTGMRLGELLGLQWKCINFDTQVVEVRHSLWEGQLFSPKTIGSVRSIPFGQNLARAFTTQLKQSLHIGPEDFVFSKSDGSALHPDVLRRDVLYPALDRLGIPRKSRAAGFHTFRHSAASIINAETGNMKLAQKLLGHSNLHTTAEIYTHTSADAERQAALALEGAICRDLFHNCSTEGTGTKGQQVMEDGKADGSELQLQ